MSSEKIQGDLVGDGMEVQGIGSYDGGAGDGTVKGIAFAFAMREGIFDCVTKAQSRPE